MTVHAICREPENGAKLRELADRMDSGDIICSHFMVMCSDRTYEYGVIGGDEVSTMDVIGRLAIAQQALVGMVLDLPLVPLVTDPKAS